MSIEQFIISAIILFGGSLIQSMIGFAFNLIAIPLLIWNGLSLAEAVVLTSIPLFVQLSLTAWKLRRSVVWCDMIIPVSIRFMTLPIGIALLYVINSLDPSRVKQIVGVILLIIIIVQLLVRFEHREHLHIAWDIAAFALSGVMLGIIGMGGPPVAVWLMAHDWSAKRARAFVTILFWIASPVQIALLYWKLGDRVAHSFIDGIWLLPVVIAGTLTGVRIGNTFDQKRLKQMVVTFLLIISVVSILSPYV